MLTRHASVNLPTEQDIKATFEAFKKANPSLNASKLSEAKDGLIPFLGFCFGIFDVYQILLLGIEIKKKQSDYQDGIKTLEEKQVALAASLEVAQKDYDLSISVMAQELVFKKTSFENEKKILDAQISDLEGQVVDLQKNLAKQKTVYETEAMASLQAKNNELSRIQEEIATAETKLAKTQKAFDNLKAKLE
jgi:hypothetical protein